MIKVNLKQTETSKKAQETKSTGLATAGASTIVTNLFTQARKLQLEDIGPEVFFKMLINVILIFCFPLGLKVYEINQINKLEKIKKQKTDFLAVANQRLSDLSAELDSYSHLQEKAEEYQTKKDFLKKIAEDRIVIARTLDIIQNKTPETVWLKKLNLELLKEHTKVSLFGKSFKEADINAFADSLNDILDRNSIIVSTKDVKEGGSVRNVEFNLEGHIGESI